MKSFFDVSLLPLGKTMIFFSILLAAGQLTLCVQAVWTRRGKKIIGLYGAYFALGFLVMLLLLDSVFRKSNKIPERTYGALSLWLYGWPWPVWLLAEALLLLLLLWCAAGNIRYLKTHLAPFSVKEAVDWLETGVCFGEESGAVLLANVRMDALCRELTGKALNDTQALWDAVKKKGKEREGQYFLRLSDGRMALFNQAAVTLEGKTYAQFTASDVTDLYRATEELRDKNKRLRDHQLRMKMLMAQTAALIPSQEILSARSALHDQFGGVLLTSKYYFDHPESTDTDALLKIVTETNSLFLRQAMEPDDAASSYENAVRLCGRIGVSLKVEGNMPGDQRVRDVLGRAVIECAANTVKHAEGRALTVRLVETEGKNAAVFTNDGLPPAGPILESGGLRSLRLMTEGMGGGMDVQWQPVFSLTLTFPKNSKL